MFFYDDQLFGWRYGCVEQLEVFLEICRTNRGNEGKLQKLEKQSVT